MITVQECQTALKLHSQSNAEKGKKRCTDLLTFDSQVKILQNQTLKNKSLWTQQVQRDGFESCALAEIIFTRF